jgi:hypothetical protein
MDGPGSRSGRCGEKKILAMPGIEPLAVVPVARLSDSLRGTLSFITINTRKDLRASDLGGLPGPSTKTKIEN